MGATTLCLNWLQLVGAAGCTRSRSLSPGAGAFETQLDGSKLKTGSIASDAANTIAGGSSMQEKERGERHPRPALTGPAAQPAVRCGERLARGTVYDAILCNIQSPAGRVRSEVIDSALCLLKEGRLKPACMRLCSTCRFATCS